MIRGITCYPMPLYEYQCKKCGHKFERIQKFSDKPVKKCPECGGPVEKTISAPAVQFKGSGWYVTDYARKSQAPSSRPDGGKEGKESKKDDKAKPEPAAKETSSKGAGSKASEKK
jgi:putative FmdB family regulatory protein